MRYSVPKELGHFKLSASIRQHDGKEMGCFHIDAEIPDYGNLEHPPIKLRITSDSLDWLQSLNNYLLPVLEEISSQMSEKSKAWSKEKMDAPDRKSYETYLYEVFHLTPKLDKEKKEISIVIDSMYIHPRDGSTEPSSEIIHNINAILTGLRQRSHLLDDDLYYQTLHRIAIHKARNLVRFPPIDRDSIGYSINYDRERFLPNWRNQGLDETLTSLLESVYLNLNGTFSGKKQQNAIVLFAYTLNLLSRADIAINGLYASPASYEIAGMAGYAAPEEAPSGMSTLDPLGREALYSHCRDLVEKVAAMIGGPDTSPLLLEQIRRALKKRDDDRLR